MFTIIIPTFNHQDTIRYAIQSILNQSIQDFEIFVVSDGAPQRTKDIVESICDSRIHYYENLKGEGHGERYRAKAIEDANGDFIAYLGDDDIWLPQHLETLSKYKNDFDFIQSSQATIRSKDDWHIFAGDLKNDNIKQKMLHEEFNFFGPTAVIHSLSAYNKLPYGWRTKPNGVWSDLHMWRQWLSEDWVKFKSIPEVTVLQLGSIFRQEMDIKSRCEEMKFWLNEISKSNFYGFVISKQLHSWQEQISQNTKKRISPDPTPETSYTNHWSQPKLNIDFKQN